MATEVWIVQGKNKVRLTTRRGIDITDEVNQSLRTTLTKSEAVVGKLAANSGVDIGNVGIIGGVDITSEPSGDGTYTTPTHTAPSIGSDTTAVLYANAKRLYALLINDSDEAIYIKLGAVAVMNQGIRLNSAGGSYEMSKKLGNLYTGAIHGICTSGSKVLLVLEGV